MMEVLEWEKPGINYWENENCPRQYLEDALIELAHFVEGVEISKTSIKHYEESKLREEVGNYEYFLDK